MDAFLLSPPGIAVMMLLGALVVAVAFSVLRVVIDTISPPRGIS
jgi:hypothetical protein